MTTMTTTMKSIVTTESSDGHDDDEYDGDDDDDSLAGICRHFVIQRRKMSRVLIWKRTQPKIYVT